MKKYSKNKKFQVITSLLLAFMMMFSSIGANFLACAQSDGSAEETPFEFDAETGTITGYKDGNPPADLVIPEKINGVQVKHIGDKAFYYSEYGGTINKQLNSVTLPEGLESLGYMAFQKNNLTEIKLPSTLTTLGQRSLSYNKLTAIEFPKGLKSIGKEAFQENEFTEIEIPSYIEEIGEGAFKTNKIEKVILHGGLITIGAKAFEDNLIEEIEIPETVVNWPSTDKDNSIFRNNGKGTGTLYLAKVYNNSGATPKNTFGIVNPASVTIEYKDSNGAEIKPSKTIVGKELKIAEKEGTGYRAPIVAVEGSGKDLLNYDAEFGYKLIEVIDDISENYYQMGKEYTFKPEEIEGYELPEVQTVKLDKKENIITFEYTKEGQEPAEDLTKPAKIELSFPGDKQVTPLYPGSKQIINVKVLNGKDEEVKGEEVSFESSNPDVLKFSFLDTFIAGEVEEETEVTITAKLKSNPEITGSIKVIVTPKTEENVINANIKDIKPYLDEQTGASYNYLLSMAMIHNGEDANDIKKKMYIRDNYTSASELAENIMTLVAVGEDPAKYKNKNYVKELVDSQQKDGNFKLGYSSPSDKDLMMSIIALDRANADYNKETATNLLLKKAKKDGTKYYYDNTGVAGEDTIERTSLGLIALSSHQENPEVMKVIGGIKRYFKSRQYKDGNIEGFRYNGDPQFRASSTATVIQSIMAIGDDPLSKEWTKDGKNMLDGLLKFRTSKGFKEIENGLTDTNATINAFAALTDLKNEKSMYGEVTEGKEVNPDLNKPYSIKIRFEGGKIIS
ncbi:leucine-rich repeat domain-containing protein, partial [Anaerosalibacter bizertensis]|nr:leucine-rich repeat domain-containing protein [Anaerosalibacter bizertensis]